MYLRKPSSLFVQKINIGTIYIDCYKDNEPIYNNSQKHELDFSTLTDLIIGYDGGMSVESSSFNLNSIKVYSNGNLIYQPCLKIPYTLSKTDSKIVDVAYRDRVQDLYEQTGEALFYTLD